MIHGMLSDSHPVAERYRRYLREAAWLRHQFHANGHVILPGFLEGEGFAPFREAVRRISGDARRRDLIMESTGGTPRHMSTMCDEHIDELTPLVTEMYSDTLLLELLSGIVGEQVLTLPQGTEEDLYVLNYLHQPGDTHGGHFDDYPFSLVIILTCPEEAQGGYVQLCQDAQSVQDLEGPRARRVVLRPGDAYLLRGNTTAHSVAPIVAGTERIALSLAYTTASFVLEKQSESTGILYRRD
jgi:hypothetical protein